MVVLEEAPSGDGERLSGEGPFHAPRRVALFTLYFPMSKDRVSPNTLPLPSSTV